MENKLYTVKIKNTDSNSRAEFRRQFHLIWDKCDIQYYQNKRQESHVKKELQAAGITANNYPDSTPPKIDLNLLIEEGGNTPEESKRLVLEEMTIVAKERSYIQSKRNIPTENLAKDKIYRTKSVGNLIINIPFLIEIISTYFLKQKDLSAIEKIQWKNLIISLQNTSPNNEESILKEYTSNKLNSNFSIFSSKVYDEISKQNLKELYHQLNIYIHRLIKEGNAIIPSIVNNTINVLSDDVPYEEYIILSINDLYINKTKLSGNTKKFWQGFIQDINTKKRTAKSIFNNPHYQEIIQYVRQNIDTLKTRLDDILVDKYGKQDHNAAITVPNFILAISEKYLSNDGLSNDQLKRWLDILEGLISNNLSVSDILGDTDYMELRVFIYEDYIFRILNNEKIALIDIEEYRTTLIAEIDRLSDSWLYYDNTEDKNLQKDIGNAYKLLKKENRIIEVFRKYEVLFLILDLFVDIKKLSDEKRYPHFSLLYAKFKESKWYEKLLNKEIYNLRDRNKSIVLEEVVVTSNKYINLDYVHIESKKSGTSTTYYKVTASKVLEFLTRYKGVISSFREVVPYTTKEYSINGVKTKGKIALRYLDSELKIGFYRYKVKLLTSPKFQHSHPFFEEKINLSPDSFEFVYESKSNRYEYNLYVKDSKGANIICFNTSDFQAIEHLFNVLDFKVDKVIIEELVQEFVIALQYSGDKRNQLDRLYASLPTPMYQNVLGRVSLDGKREGINAKHGIDDAELKKDLINILGGWVTDGSTIFDDGTNEERAVVNILMAMTPKVMYDLLIEDNKLLYKIFDKLCNNILVSDPSYERFVNYLVPIILTFHNQKAQPIVWFGNEYWFSNDIEIEMSEWSAENTNITIKNYYQPYINIGNFVGTNQFLSDSEKIYHPLDLVEMNTMISGEAVSVVKVPVFFLYHKVKTKTNWDTFNVIMDIISILSVYGAARVLVAKGVSRLAKLGAVAVIAKESSTFLLQNDDLTNWLGKEHPEALRFWRAIDTAGDIAYVLDSLSKIKSFINHTGKGISAIRAANITVPDRFKEWLKRAKELAKKQHSPELETALVLDGFGAIRLDPLDNLLLQSKILFMNTSKQVDEMVNLMRSGSKKVKTALKSDIEELIKLAQKDGAKAWLNELESFRKSVETGSRTNYHYLLKLEQLKLKKRKGAELTLNQLKYFFELENLKGLDDKTLKQLLTHGMDTPNVSISPKKALEQIHNGWTYTRGKGWTSPNKVRIDRINKTIDILRAKGYTSLVKLAEETKNYLKIHDEGFKKFIIKATNEDFNKYLDNLRVDGKAGYPFMPNYKQLGEGLEQLRRIAKKTKEVDPVALKKIMKGYERHHQFMINVMQRNNTFQMIMDWALKRKPPLDIGFNDFKRNIIILHKEQHGYHNITTAQMHEKINTINNISNKTDDEIRNLKKFTKDINDEEAFMEAFLELKLILKREEKSIIKEVIQKRGSSLDQRFK